MKYYIDALKNYAKFSGRATRKEFWMFALFNFIVSIIVSIVASIIRFDSLSGLYCLAVLIPNLAIMARRLHDTDRSAWWILINLIPVIGQIVIFIFMLLPSKQGQNSYDTNPITSPNQPMM